MTVTKQMHGDLLETLDLVLEFLDNYSDAWHEEDGSPTSNQAMRLHAELAQAVERLQRQVEARTAPPNPHTEERKLERVIKVLKAAKPAVSVKTDYRALASGILMAIEEQP